jgi:putative endonuclease
MTSDNDNVLYTGMANDLVRSVTEHRADEIPGFYEHCTNALDAIAREKQIKTCSRAKRVTLIDRLIHVGLT